MKSPPFETGELDETAVCRISGTLPEMARITPPTLFWASWCQRSGGSADRDYVRLRFM
jgi:hypothetical protein